MRSKASDLDRRNKVCAGPLVMQMSLTARRRFLKQSLDRDNTTAAPGPWYAFGKISRPLTGQ